MADSQASFGPPTRSRKPTAEGYERIYELCDSYYEFDSHDQACWFNEEQEKADKPLMLELLGRLNARIAELNDGSFAVDNRETPRVEAL